MAKKHIIKINHYRYACDSIADATAAVKILSKLKSVEWVYEPEEDVKSYFVETDEVINIELELNKDVRDKAKPKRLPKPLALPKPKRGTIRCICDQADVAPRQFCTACGVAFEVSHGRTHDSAKNVTAFRLNP
jgi:hypothetical protein